MPSFGPQRDAALALPGFTLALLLILPVPAHAGEAVVAAATPDAAASQDYDAFLFGAPILVRNLALSGRRKLPRKDVYVDVVPEQLVLDVTLTALGLTRDQLVDVGILMGTDFNKGVHGVGPKKALALVKAHRSLEGALRELGASIEDAERIREIFLRPEVADEYELAWREPDVEGATRMLVDEHDFSAERIEGALRKVLESRKQGGQESLDRWS